MISALVKSCAKPQEQQIEIEALPTVPTIDYGKAPQRLVNLAERRAETIQFVQNWERDKDKLPATATGRPALVHDGIPHFLQWDPRWGYTIYAGEELAITGCGPTCVSMVVVGLTNNTSWTPYAVSHYAQMNGYVEGGVTGWRFMSEGTQQFGVQGTSFPLTKNNLNRYLDEGHPVILSMGPGDFTQEGHFIVVTGRDENSNYRINDSMSMRNTLRTWTFEQLQPQARAAWYFTKL